MSTEQAAADKAAAVELAAALLADRQWPVIVTLKQPVDFGTERITSLEFRRGKMGHLNGLKVDETPTVNQLLLLASRMCGKPLAVLELLDDDDGSEVLDIALGFFVRSLPGGKKR